MKESRFIELLNLYVDQELSPAEAAQLEAEIASNPARRRTYEQYCRMQRGCAMLFEQIRSNAPAHDVLSRAGHAADRKVLDFPVERAAPRRGFGATLAATLAWGGGLAAAAAVVTVALVRQPVSPGGSMAAVDTPVAASTVADASEAASRRPTHYQLAASLNPGASGAAAFSNQETVDLGWMNTVQLSALPRLSPEDLEFRQDVPVAPRATSLLHTHSVPYTPGEAFNAFEFRR